MKNRFYFISIFCLAFIFMQGQDNGRTRPRPSPSQLSWHDQEFYLFAHFGPNTFSGLEWGHGTETEDLFNPSELDCRQWCRIAKAAGAKGIIITAKHHDGFCLWPSKYSTHTVKESKWKNGKGDVLKELSDACREYGLKFGVYISPWDRNHPQYGTPAYNDVFVNMMKEIFTRYGPVWELWWDGANGEGPNGKRQEYDWKRFEQTVRRLSPNTVIFSDIGPDIRWVGNESGVAGKTNWNFLDTAGFTRGAGGPPTDTLNAGNYAGKNWMPAECDVSIRPGWFYHENENGKVKTPEQLFRLYLVSVGRGANLLLNVPPDRKGRIHEEDSAALSGFRKLHQQNFSNNLAKKATVFIEKGNRQLPVPILNDGKKSTTLVLENSIPLKFFLKFPRKQKINCLVLQEGIRYGQKIRGFTVSWVRDGNQETIRGSSIGHKRIMTFPAIETYQIILTIDQAEKKPELAEIGAYLIEEKLVEN